MSALQHWRLQRISARLLTFLLLWLLVSFINLANFNSATIADWLQSPLTSLLLWVTVTASFYHGKLGMDVIFEDYVSTLKTLQVLEWGVSIGLFLVWLLLSVAILNNLLS